MHDQSRSNSCLKFYRQKLPVSGLKAYKVATYLKYAQKKFLNT
jgi:hypothetical protein